MFDGDYDNFTPVEMPRHRSLQRQINGLQQQTTELRNAIMLTNRVVMVLGATIAFAELCHWVIFR